MKLVIRLLVVWMVVGCAVVCMASEPRVGVGFVLKIHGSEVLSAPDELVALVEAYGNREASEKFAVNINNVSFNEGVCSIGIFVEERVSQADTSAFAEGMVEYIKRAMGTCFEETFERLGNRSGNLIDERHRLKNNLERWRAEISDVSKISPFLESQFETIIDLSELSPEMPAAEAFDMLRDSVSPRANIVVYWKDLLDNAEVEPVTPIDLDSISEISLGMALEVLLKALSGGVYDISYRTQDSIIMVGTKATLPASVSDSYLALVTAEHTSSERFNERRENLMLEIEDLEMELSVQQASNSAIRRDVSKIQERINRAMANDPVLKDFESLVKAMEIKLRAVQPNSEAYVNAMEQMVSIRMKVADHRANLINQSGGAELADINDEMRFSGSKMAGDMARLQGLKRQLTRVEKDLALCVSLRGTVSEIKATEKALAEINGQIERVESQMANLERPKVICLGL